MKHTAYLDVEVLKGEESWGAFLSNPQKYIRLVVSFRLPGGDMCIKTVESAVVNVESDKAFTIFSAALLELAIEIDKVWKKSLFDSIRLHNPPTQDAHGNSTTPTDAG